MNILVIGGGGREHALVWKLSQSSRVKRIFCAPGNAGISAIAQCIDVPTGDIPSLLKFARPNRVDLTVVGPEAPLAAGIVNIFQKDGLKIFGPTQAAAKLESSKVFTKNFCRRHKIPTAPFKVFEKADEAKEYLMEKAYPLVIKADGLAAGKGVQVCTTKEEALSGVETLLAVSNQIIIEDFLHGEEVSFMALVDGKNILPLSSARDYKRLLDGDKGPNTGGMGAYSPSPIITASLYEKIIDRILQPTVAGMAAEGNPFVGILYAGLMIHGGEPKLLEYNVRFGDPEAQVILPRLKTDLVDLIERSLTENLNDIELSWETKVAVCVVMASEGYPQHYQTGLPVQGIEEAMGLKKALVFHAGTEFKNQQVMATGGRVLGVTALGKDLKEAANRAYEAAGKISWQGSFYRRDIAGSEA